MTTEKPQLLTSFPASRHRPEIRHPLDPLSADEIEQAGRLVHSHYGSRIPIAYISLCEPEKHPSDPADCGSLDRRVTVITRDGARKATFEAKLSLTDSVVLEWLEVAGAQPMLRPEEFERSEHVVKQDPAWQAALTRRGISPDPDHTSVDTWAITPAAETSAPLAPNERRAYALTFVKPSPEDNQYARPVEGLIVTLDLDDERVISVQDTADVPIPEKDGNYDLASLSQPSNVPFVPDGYRTDLRPLETIQPEGTSFHIEGHHVLWQRWDLRVGWSLREGLTLHDIHYNDRGRRRPILYRASMSEMFIPYGDPAPTHRIKNAFDVGECGLGITANSLVLGCDCPGETQYLDAVVNDSRGSPLIIRNAVCMHEEDHGILWKHTNPRTGISEVRRSRRFVVSSIATVGNYDYGFYWYFYQDGTIEFEVKLTGIVSTGAYTEPDRPLHGSVLAPGLYGPHHQHFFCVRLDPMIDGAANTVFECDSVPIPRGEENPRGNAWRVQSAVLESELVATREIDTSKQRFWKIVNSNHTNAIGEPVAYALIPGSNAAPLLAHDAPSLRRAGFARHHLWVTAFSPSELFAAGDYPHLSQPDQGLPSYIANDRSLVDTDIVLWHVFGAHHVVRPEDWPVMPATHAGFQLRPMGFFDGNPAMDVAPSQACHVPGASCQGDGSGGDAPHLH